MALRAPGVIRPNRPAVAPGWGKLDLLSCGSTVACRIRVV